MDKKIRRTLYDEHIGLHRGKTIRSGDEGEIITENIASGMRRDIRGRAVPGFAQSSAIKLLGRADDLI
jgi:hypothetical protein